MLEEKKENILEDNYYLKKRKKARLKTRFLAIKNRLFILGIVFGILITAVLYLMLPSSEVFKVVVKGNEYLKDDYYIKLSKIKDGDKFLLVNLNKVKNQISSSSIVDSVTVKRNNYNLIEINVKEKEIIGYTYEVEPKILLSDGSTINLENDYLNVIASVPLIEGYDEEGLKLIAIGFKKLDQKMIGEISEIHRYPFSYDENMLEVIMRDGNYLYLSYYSLSMLNEYYTIASGITVTEDKACIFLDEMTNSGYTSECPYWTKIEEKTDEMDNLTTE
ncbi:MAG: FtsQ-type POTRA domain-containing protein [Erysipelotrichaceae bacterium]|nr:FtsQ-type POTRA domain-containing protein [Erysipelotrichaceae bacterium]